MSADVPRAWSDEIECAGGAVLLANTADFVDWTGAVPEAIGHEAVHLLGSGHSVYLWNALPGTVRVSTDGARDSLCMAQVEYADNDSCREAAYAFALAFRGAPLAPLMQYTVTHGPVLIAWSGNQAADSSTALASLPLSASTPGALVDFARGQSAAALWLRPGVYASSLFFHEEDRWGVSWCRLQRLP
jgi:hypothetical protein